MPLMQILRLALFGETPPITRDQDAIRETSRLRIEQRAAQKRFDHELDRVDKMFMKMASDGKGERK